MVEGRLVCERATRLPSAIAALLALGSCFVVCDTALHPPAGTIVAVFSPGSELEPQSWSPLGIFFFLGGSLVAVVAALVFVRLLAAPKRRTLPGHVVLGRGRLVVGGKTVIARIVGSAAIERTSGVYEVHIFDGRRHPGAVLTGMAAADVEAIELATKPRRSNGFFEPASFCLGHSASAGRRRWIFVPKDPATFLLFALVALPFLRQRAGVVFADRLVVRAWRVEQTVVLADIADTAVRGCDLLLRLRSGGTVRVHAETHAQILALARHLTLSRRGAGPSATASLLARNGRSTASWVDALSCFDAQDYRRSALSREELWTILFDTASERSARATAALLVRAAATKMERRRLAKLAGTFQDAAVRKALAAIASTTPPSSGDAVRVLAAVD